MRSDARNTAEELTRRKLVPIFVMHQFVGTWGVALFAYYVGSAVFQLLAMINPSYSMRPLHWILTETPFFPVQIILGLYLGWLLARRLKHRQMVWVWIIPGLILGYAVIAVPNLSPVPTSVLAHSGGTFSHYFGWGCQPKDQCLDQLLVTMPFYAATAYSIGARLAFTSAASHP
jgi:hypothetical protein